jgi:outer membrane protein OmpA-like peptidoglycan-associated protein
MEFKSHVVFVGVLTALFITAVEAAERETLSFGTEAPSADRVQEFLFPEAECENAKYQCLAVRPTTERSIGLDIRFQTGSWELTSAAIKQLEGLGKVLAGRSGKLGREEIIIEGHTDARGSAKFNLWLSEQRAKSVTQYLVNVYGVNARALKPVGHGKERLRDTARPDDEINRRVELVRRTQ